MNNRRTILPERFVNQPAERGDNAMNRRRNRSGYGRDRLGGWGRRRFDGRGRRHNCTRRWRLCGGGLLSGLWSSTGNFIAMGMSTVSMLQWYRLGGGGLCSTGNFSSLPIPPVSAPTAPPVRGDAPPLSWLMDEAFRQNRTPIIQKLYPFIGSKRAHSLSLPDVVKVANLSEDEFVQLTDLHRAHNRELFPVSDNTGISSNGIPVVHVHGPEQFGPRSNPARPLVIRINAGIAKIKSFA